MYWSTHTGIRPGGVRDPRLPPTPPTNALTFWYLTLDKSMYLYTCVFSSPYGEPADERAKCCLSLWVHTYLQCETCASINPEDQKRRWIGFWRLGWGACGWVIINYDSCRLRFYPTVRDLWDIAWARVWLTLRQSGTGRCGTWWGKKRDTFTCEHQGDL